MRRFLTFCAAITLTGCAATPEQMAARSNWDVCRFTMGGPHSRVAQAEAERRNLDCSRYYDAINAQMRNQNAATANFLQQLKGPPLTPPLSCTSRRVGNTIQTDC